MRPHVLLLVAAFAGCFSDSGPPEDASTGEGSSTTTGTPTTGEPAGCGDSVMQDGEECDQGPANGKYAACNDACVLNICGDGVLGPAEQCDDGNTDNTDSCSTMCAPPRCGDGIIAMGEACDDGNLDETDDCSSKCAPPKCGDGIINGADECDYGEMNADSGHCTAACKLKVCGDGFVQPGEACDPGAEEPVPPCTGMCTFDTCPNGMVDMHEQCEQVDMADPPCTPICTTPACGDGFVSAGEMCDDGNLLDGDGCTSGCLPSICGDGVLASDETCDDGNTADGDACNAACVRDTRYVFVSSLRYAGGALRSLEMADAECQKMAEAASLPGKYKAWLSNGAVSPATRFKKSIDRPYVLPASEMLGGAKRVADGWVDLVDGDLLHEISVTEKGELLSFGFACEPLQMAWTATSRSAGPFDGTTHCMQWMVSTGTAYGVAGLIGSSDPEWTEGCPTVLCETQARIYCFEQP